MKTVISEFCKNIKGGAYMMFNKQLTEEDWDELRIKIDIDFKKVQWTNAREVIEKELDGEELKEINDWDTRKEAWRPVKDQLACLADLEIWDEKANVIVKFITGWDVNKEIVGDDEVEIDGKKFSKKTIKNALKEYTK